MFHCMKRSLTARTQTYVNVSQTIPLISSLNLKAFLSTQKDKQPIHPCKKSSICVIFPRKSASREPLITATPHCLHTLSVNLSLYLLISLICRFRCGNALKNDFIARILSIQPLLRLHNSRRLVQ